MCIIFHDQSTMHSNITIHFRRFWWDGLWQLIGSGHFLKIKVTVICIFNFSNASKFVKNLNSQKGDIFRQIFENSWLCTTWLPVRLSSHPNEPINFNEIHAALNQWCSHLKMQNRLRSQINLIKKQFPH